MPHGRPDWLVTNANRQTFPVLDMGELAARLGSIVTYDRRGDVIFLDDFEDGLIRWLQATSGTGAAIAVDTTRARNGAQSVKLTGGSDGNRNALISHRQAIQFLGRIGFEISFMHDGSYESFANHLEVNNGSGTWAFEVRYTLASKLLEYSDEDGNYQTLDASLTINNASGLFHTIKVVLDLDAMEYVRALVDTDSYDLSGIGGFKSSSADIPEIFAQARHVSRSGQNDVVYVDDAIITQNEP